MKILGIETSCDETAAAVVEDGQKILSSVTASSEELQKKFGGIIPEQAAREQLKYIVPTIDQSLKKARLKPENIDVIAVTHGPGLIGSLLVGVETAKTLSLAWQKPVIPVNHLSAHIFANFLGQKKKFSLPALCLIVSGGHTELLLLKPNHQFIWLGGTRDDAAGECFDKTARMLGFGYPGGPEIEKAASQLSPPAGGLNSQISLPRPMINENKLDFSFSGLKTAVLTLIKKRKQFNHLAKDQFNKLVAYEIQEAITDVLVVKTLKALKRYKVKAVLVGGGVAANKRLREKMQAVIKPPISLFIPDKKLSTDNAAAVAAAAFYQSQPVKWHDLKPSPSLHFSS